jgi:hypothetical protein
LTFTSCTGGFVSSQISVSRFQGAVGESNGIRGLIERYNDVQMGLINSIGGMQCTTGADAGRSAINTTVRSIASATSEAADGLSRAMLVLADMDHHRQIEGRSRLLGTPQCF